MNRFLTAATLAALLGLGACASSPQKVSLVPVKSNGHVLTGMTTGTILESRQPGAIVSIQASDRFNAYGAAFFLAYRNMGQTQTTFGANNVTVKGPDGAIKVYSAEELEQHIQTEIVEQVRAADRGGSGGDQFSGTFGTAADLANLSEVNRQRSYNNFGGCPAGDGRCQLNPAVGSAYRQGEDNRAVNYQNSVEAAARLTRDLPAASRTALRPGPVASGETRGGLILVTPPRAGQTIDVVVDVAGHKHSFSFAAAAFTLPSAATAAPGKPAG